MATPQGYRTASVVQNASSLLYGTFNMGTGQFFPDSTPLQENFRLQHQVPVQYPIHPSQTPSPYISNGITSGVFISDTNQQLQQQQQCGATTNKQSESSVLFQHDPSRAAPSSSSSKYYQRVFPTSLLSRQYQTIDQEINMVVEHQ
ncbi:unnamed protein product [Didymodactylos carnosus]|uniref:Uncharacterized protein n=1 Tax=Didymodactylos carnosus TaxID=1234261 RepID=A0A8S2FNR7_9BILA|nr:unnamed protein product [Didymodactylos carnosus]CAF4295492.1 unnamed protein product [Didymodactylos carnosus]